MTPQERLQALNDSITQTTNANDDLLDLLGKLIEKKKAMNRPTHQDETKLRVLQKHNQTLKEVAEI